MTVLTIIGILIAALVLYITIEKFNKYTYNKFEYLFFKSESLTAVAIAYVLIYFGHKWYMAQLLKDGDILNGSILIAIGVLILLVIIYKNFKATNFLIGLFGTIFQLSVYVIGTLLSILILFGALAFFGQSKPVYRIN